MLVIRVLSLAARQISGPETVYVVYSCNPAEQNYRHIVIASK